MSEIKLLEFRITSCYHVDVAFSGYLPSKWPRFTWNPLPTVCLPYHLPIRGQEPPAYSLPSIPSPLEETWPAEFSVPSAGAAGLEQTPPRWAPGAGTGCGTLIPPPPYLSNDAVPDDNAPPLLALPLSARTKRQGFPQTAAFRVFYSMIWQVSRGGNSYLTLM